MSLELLQLEDTLWVLQRQTRLPHYDFVFERYFDYKRAEWPDDLVSAVARVGAIQDYESFYRAKWEKGVNLIHTPEEHRLASELPYWYPLLQDLTPKSLWSSYPPLAEQVEAELGWPVFLRGVRQTGRHRRDLSRIEGPDEYDRALEAFREDPILHWQDIVVREHVDLQPARNPVPTTIGPNREFRTFWWKGHLAGWGRYWWQGTPYLISREEKEQALRVAREAARRINIAFLAIDIAQRMDGTWIVVECNDGQESGYTGASAIGLWRRILDLEKSETRAAAE